MGELISRFKNYGLPSKGEIKDLIIVFLIGAFIFSFRHWGSSEVVSFAEGLRNYLVTFIVLGFSYSMHILIQRIFGLRIGTKAEFKIWFAGLIISLLVTFATNGLIPLFLPGGILLVLIAKLRIGERAHINYELQENAAVCAFGPLMNLILAFFFKALLLVAPTNYIFRQGLIINIVIAICTMLPFPPMDGIQILFVWRWTYAGYFAFIALACILLLFFGVFQSLIIAVVAVVIGSFIAIKKTIK